ncbi:putative oxidoreductase [Dehalogenimonas formicexedens]|uniref:Putative oxidoreductase n=1 Tax=Dehalogenimonas formicexedens TaxID=1839801 RepID=A0A1P8F780_9CHLR|nr:Rossmann-like and DUF2520 domain-containing protein [Dehalogenimonas formicexedens]APV44344.1 putative oxidoreductase [Dehalogenimonas formicexedens]
MADNGLRIGFIGAGKVGNTLAMALVKAGYSVNAVTSNDVSSAYKMADKLPSAVVFDSPEEMGSACDLIFITTPDSVISEIAASIPFHPGLMICHTAAAVAVSALDGLKKSGALTGVFHPLQAIGSKNAEILPGITFAIEADEPLLTILRQMAVRLDGRTIALKENDRVLYHASAIFASNYLVTLVSLAAELWQGFGTSEQAVRALMPLMRGTLDNVEQIGIPECLTGPVARGDIDSIKLHLEALVEHAPTVLDVYRILGLHTVPIALAKGGIDREKADRLLQILEKKQ